ncbi:putative membrane-anchored protein [Advenella kashmirensis WT001]|uniref:Putative membrane-anchored protein n=1 Tax=Advenella kashmirensis (strain DSM 17095 / LMG 22695 / WT001) TaxID=1036672 RepID=I3U7T1_ADVKW|nr:GDYXXLXY domain-containing protein [Advenella kashmirensis]AFK61069.1 putative membrane-anchored protein [Advenella kashmirensis WT001]
MFVTDAYFFPEGQGEHFARARYGEFRVNQDGVALLTGLLDEKQNRL